MNFAVEDSFKFIWKYKWKFLRSLTTREDWDRELKQMERNVRSKCKQIADTYFGHIHLHHVPLDADAEWNQLTREIQFN